ncbi:MAG: CRISPR-associated protein, Csa2 family [Candidatus Methanosuratincola subterraneus]|uniref:CRISPR-associated protein, Csa2 family n=1 Tax=Methanosuratincola subterraneus TaxID=2593994 RepID=A0A3S4UG14_METS7|nr:MAG: CRISPR-associated protein, Csa2 family [Candidatus Methanosuratincola subterraneus]
MKGFLSTSFRLLVNVESLNGIESIGNLSRHRTVPIVVNESGGYTIRYVPAISGESIAHAYQELLVKRAKEMNLPVGLYSSRGEFIKFTDDKFLEEEGIKPPGSMNDLRKVESQIMLKDIVSDVGGFLYAGKKPIKRTSRFQIGYMIPALEEVNASALEAQFHVRHALSEMKKGQLGETRAQIPYNVEVGSAVYTFTYNMDVDGISRVSTAFGMPSEEENALESQRESRVKAALMAFVDLVSTMCFGAKRSRFLPTIEPLGAVACVSAPGPFLASPGNSRWFIGETVRRATRYTETMKKLGLERRIEILSFTKEPLEEKLDEIEVLDNLEHFAQEIVEKVLET